MTSLQLPRDYQELLEEFVAAEVEFVLIGGWALKARRRRASAAGWAPTSRR